MVSRLPSGIHTDTLKRQVSNDCTPTSLAWRPFHDLPRTRSHTSGQMGIDALRLRTPYRLTAWLKVQGPVDWISIRRARNASKTREEGHHCNSLFHHSSPLRHSISEPTRPVVKD